jgi:hypothetical protein
MRPGCVAPSRGRTVQSEYSISTLSCVTRSLIFLLRSILRDITIDIPRCLGTLQRYGVPSNSLVLTRHISSTDIRGRLLRYSEITEQLPHICRRQCQHFREAASIMGMGEIRAWRRRGYCPRQQTVAHHRAIRIRFYQWRSPLTDRSQVHRGRGPKGAQTRFSVRASLNL